jgi:hypothetical protein
MDTTYTIEFYSRKKMFSRRQYYWRIRHWNGKVVGDGSEGYYNRKERDDEFYKIVRALSMKDYTVIEL